MNACQRGILRRAIGEKEMQDLDVLELLSLLQSRGILDRGDVENLVSWSQLTAAVFESRSVAEHSKDQLRPSQHSAHAFAHSRTRSLSCFSSSHSRRARAYRERGTFLGVFSCLSHMKSMFPSYGEREWRKGTLEIACERSSRLACPRLINSFSPFLPDYLPALHYIATLKSGVERSVSADQVDGSSPRMAAVTVARKASRSNATFGCMADI